MGKATLMSSSSPLHIIPHKMLNKTGSGFSNEDLSEEEERCLEQLKDRILGKFTTFKLPGYYIDV
jgi:hypothetical protein